MGPGDVLGDVDGLAIALNHENPESESVVEQNDRYAVVETFAGASSRIARESDPRSQRKRRRDAALS